ncbi:MAG: hypothetical protein LR015_11835 [Verrucomicrobia bacterium]|nr:hypothetical protein [Verrucomicrobiota bacterium]
MSCGQRSQVALGLLLAQKPDLIIFDDYSLGLDPGYRHLFIDVIKEFAADGKRTILLTSHIIQDLEDLIDDCLIYQRGSVLVDMPTKNLREQYRCYGFTTTMPLTESFEKEGLVRLEHKPDHWRLYGFFDTRSSIGLVAPPRGGNDGTTHCCRHFGGSVYCYDREVLIVNHFSAFFYKEWIKTSKVWWLLFAANLAVAIFVCLRLHNSFRLGDPASNWGSWVFNSSTFFLRYNYLPVLTGLLLAVVQFLPEILNKRIRLFLHLPLNEEKAVVLHLLIGVLLLALAVTPAVVLILTVGLWYFPIEFAGTALSILTLGCWRG